MFRCFRWLGVFLCVVLVSGVFSHACYGTTLDSGLEGIDITKEGLRFVVVPSEDNMSADFCLNATSSRAYGAWRTWKIKTHTLEQKEDINNFMLFGCIPADYKAKDKCIFQGGIVSTQPKTIVLDYFDVDTHVRTDTEGYTASFAMHDTKEACIYGYLLKPKKNIKLLTADITYTIHGKTRKTTIQKGISTEFPFFMLKIHYMQEIQELKICTT